MNTQAQGLASSGGIVASILRQSGEAERLLRGIYVLALLASDLLMQGAAYRLAYWLRFDMKLTLAPEIVPSIDFYFTLTTAIAFGGIFLFALAGLYSWPNLLGGTTEYARAFNVCTICFLLVVSATFLFPALIVSRIWLATSWVFSVVFVFSGRFLLRRVVYGLRAKGYFLVNAAIVGDDEVSWDLAEELQSPRSGYRVTGLIGLADRSRTPAPKHDADSLRVVGVMEDLEQLVGTLQIKELVVPASLLTRPEIFDLYSRIHRIDGLELRVSSELFDLVATGVHVRTAGVVPLIGLKKARLDPMELIVKTTLEFVITIVGLIMVLPVLILVAAAIKLDSPGPVIYRRRVVGVGGREFDAFKFRTMQVDGERILERFADLEDQLRETEKLKKDPRITRSGYWLRRFSLDELPQLFNVLWGQMSLVGPRMISPPEAVKYGRNRFSLLTVKPGMTGLWQVSGRSDLSYDERVRLDMYYIRNYTIWMDLHILFVKTANAVVQGRGAY